LYGRYNLLTFVYSSDRHFVYFDTVIIAQINLIFLSFKVAEFLLEKGADVNSSNVSFKLYPYRNEKKNL